MHKYGLWGSRGHSFKELSVKIWSWNLVHRLKALNEAFGIFLGPWSWLHYGAKETWVLSDWKELQSWNFTGSFLDSFQDLEILFSSLGLLVKLLFKIFSDKSSNHKFLWRSIKKIKLSFHWIFMKKISEVTRSAHDGFRPLLTKFWFQISFVYCELHSGI
jgi:hypothetical protein